MSKMLRIVSLRNMFVLSVAMNVSLVLRILVTTDVKHGNTMIEKTASYVRDQKAMVSSSSSSSSSSSCSGNGVDQEDKDRIINLDHGDPTMYEKYWQQMGTKTTIVIPGWQSLSYFSDISNLCWFLEPQLGKEIERVHRIVGNAVTQDRYIVVGTGSTQLYQAALYALSPGHESGPINVVSAAPFYSSYPLITDCLKSGLYRWAGDANSYREEGPYIELVTSPNNPDGSVRQSVVNRGNGILVHDLAYYWPQYTPITYAADHDVMLFTVSKSTGHAGMRIGWALVKDKEVAKRMTKFVELNTIGVSKDSQIRAARVLKVVSDGCEMSCEEHTKSFFAHSHGVMSERWRLLRGAAKKSKQFSLPEFTPQHCKFLGRVFESQPAFAWLKCEEVGDCESFLKERKILTRSGKHFGYDRSYVRISMLERDANFNLFVRRISSSSNSTM